MHTSIASVLKKIQALHLMLLIVHIHQAEFIADHIHLLDITTPDEDEPNSPGTQATRVGPADPHRTLGQGGDNKCAVTLATLRGPAFDRVAVKLFQATTNKGAHAKFLLEQLMEEKAKDSGVSLVLLLMQTLPNSLVMKHAHSIIFTNRCVPLYIVGCHYPE